MVATQIFFEFSPQKTGEDKPILTVAYFFKGVVQPSTSNFKDSKAGKSVINRWICCLRRELRWTPVNGRKNNPPKKKELWAPTSGRGPPCIVYSFTSFYYGNSHLIQPVAGF